MKILTKDAREYKKYVDACLNNARFDILGTQCFIKSVSVDTDSPVIGSYMIDVELISKDEITYNI
jgi:hypothetical protein